MNEDHVYDVDNPIDVKVKRRPQFRPVLSFGQQGSTVGMYVCPWGVAVNERNEIAEADNDNNRIEVFSSRMELTQDRLVERVINRENLTFLLGYLLIRMAIL